MWMKNFFLFALLSVFTLNASAQFGVSYHQSSMPFLGFNYEMEDQFFAEIRAGANNYFENVAFEMTANYIFLKHPDYEVYGGIGGRTTRFSGLVVPTGVNVYPFENRHFGFHIEAAGLFGEVAVLRASWGIRYHFGSPGSTPQQKGE